MTLAATFSGVLLCVCEQVYGALYTSFAFAGVIGTMGAKALAKSKGIDFAFTALSGSSLLAFAALQLHARPKARAD